MKSLNFTEQDFELIIKGLKSINSTEMVGEVLSELILSSAGDRRSPEQVEQLKRQHEEYSKQREAKRREQEENVMILQTKLIGLKRYLKANDALSTEI